MSYTKIVQVGAGGNVGKPVLNKIIEAGRFEVTVLARESSSYTAPHPSVTVQKLDLHNHDALVAALQGVDVVLLTFGDFANLEANSKPIIDAAIAAGVKRIIPSEFGSDIHNPPGSTQIVWAPKRKLNEYLEEKGAAGEIEYTFIVTGSFFDWGLGNQFLGFDIPNQKAKIWDDGNAKINATTLDSVGQAVVGVFSNPSATKNRLVRVHDFYTSQNEILAGLEEVTGKKYEIERADSAKLEETSLAGLQRGEWTDPNIYGLVTAYIFGKNSSSSWGDSDDSELLGLQKKDLKEEIRRVL